MGRKLLFIISVILGIVGSFLGAWACVDSKTNWYLALPLLMLGFGLLLYALLYFRLLLTE